MAALLCWCGALMGAPTKGRGISSFHSIPELLCLQIVGSWKSLQLGSRQGLSCLLGLLYYN